MSYLSIEFTVLFLCFFVAYWLLRQYPALQNRFLLVASYLLVSTFSFNFVLVLAGYTVVIYCISIFIVRSKYQSQQQKFWFIIAIIAAVGNLAFFKYFDFFRTELQNLFNLLEWNYLLPSVEILMPIGISFYTFHSISYLFSVRNQQISIPTFLDFALFLSFFPSIIAGPINRAVDFLPQIITSKPRDILEPYRALILILSAIIKVYWLSAFISENWVDPVFSSPMEYHSLDLLFVMYAYAIELYLNFSGYTELVTGIALLLGFRLPINFNFPYLALNLRDFWQRWHISLSTWIRDYVYIPLGGSKKSFSRTQINLIIAMLLSGFWHGAGANFILWGAIHGIGVVWLNISQPVFGRYFISNFSVLFAKLCTFHYVCFAWVFFRSSSFTEAVEFFSSLIHNTSGVGLHFNSLIYILLLFCFYCIYPLMVHLQDVLTQLISRIYWILLPLFFTVVLWCVISFAPSGIPNFIYAGF